jgi:hypothetical protein
MTLTGPAVRVSLGHREGSQPTKEALMDEVLPVLSGIAVGLVLGIVPFRFWTIALGVFSVVSGIVASVVSGELAISWIYVLIDAAQVLGAALLTSVLAARWRQRSWRLR